MSSETMTPRERFLAAMRNEIPDRVPVAPDISTYIPTQRTGLPYWEVLMEGKVPLWQVYLEAADYFGMDAWTAPVMGIPFQREEMPIEWQSKLVYHKERDAMLRFTNVRTPDGDLSQEEVCFRQDPPSTTIKFIKDIRADFKKFRWLMPKATGVDTNALEIQRAACQKRDYAFGVTVTYPGFQNWNSYVDGGIQALAYAEQDSPEILAEWCAWDNQRGDEEMKLTIEARPDYILFGGSGTITLASPRLAAKYCIPALKRWSQWAKDAGIPTMLHSCGKDRVLADLLAADTAVGMLNPLEIPPMGDIDLAEVKRKHGQRLGFMGNLHTTEVMLFGTPQYVRSKALEAMRAAGLGGGFILSTGDQCGRETPEENLFAIVEAARKYGRYDRTTGQLPDLPEGI